MGIEERRIQLKCNSCGGTMEVCADREILKCPYCDAKDLIVQSDSVKIQKIKSDAYRDVEYKRQETYRDVELGKHAYEIDRRKLEISERKHNDKIFIGLILILLVMVVFANGMAMYYEKKEAAKHIGHIKMICSAKEYKSENYEDVVDGLQTLGFVNIEVEGMEDLVTGWLTKEGAVDSVSINGDKDFSEGDYFSKDAKIKIYYHSFKEDGE